MPLFAAFGAYVAGAIGLVGAAATVVGALVAVGAAYVTSRVINGNPNKGKNAAAGSQGGRIQVPPATNNKIPVAYGNSFINGIITDARLITTDQKINNTMYYCIVLSETCHTGSPTYTIDNIFYNDLRLVFDATDGYKVVKGVKKVNGPGEDFEDDNFVSDGKNLVEVRVYAGGSESVNQIFPTTGATPAYTYWGDNNGDWDNTFAMKGLVFAIVRITYDGAKGFTGLPNMTFQLNNTVSNPANVWYDYMTGQRYGAGIAAADIDTSAKTAWANFCDEDINYEDKDGNTNQLTTRYSINGVIDTARPVKENIDIIMQNAGAWLSYNVSTGLWSPLIKKAVTAGELGLPATYFTASRTGSTLTVTNFPAGRIEAGQLLYNSANAYIGTIVSQTTPTAGQTAGQIGVYTTDTSGNISSTTFYTLPATMLAFSDDNIISGINISSTRLDDLYNSYEAEFYDKYNKDQRAYARDEILAGERNPNEPDNQLRLSLDLCNNSVQADLLAKLELAQSRDDLVVDFTTTHYGIQAQAGDVISIYSDLYGWEPKYFRVMRVKEIESDDGSLTAHIQALEYNPDVYTIEPLTEFTTSANIGIGVYGASPNLPLPPAVVIARVDADASIPNFELQITVPTDGGPFDEIEIFYTEGWDEHPITGTIVPGTGSNGAAIGQGLLTVTATTYGNINAGDRIDMPHPTPDIFIVSQLTNTVGSKTFVSGGVPASTTSTLLTLNNVTGLIVGNTLTGTGIPNGSFIIEIDAGTNTVRIEDAVTVQAAGTYTVTGGLGTYVVDTSTTATLTAVNLFDFPEDDNYKPLKIIVPPGNTPTFTNGEIIRDVITNVPANSATYRRWFIKSRMGIKKRFGAFSNPGATDFTAGRFPYSPNPVAAGKLTDLTDVLITSPLEGETLYYDSATSQWKNNGILKINDSTTGVEIYNTAGTRVRRTETTTNTAITSLTVSGATTGTTAAGFGTGIALENEISPDNYTIGAYITSLITDVTSGSEDADLLFTLQSAGSTTNPLKLSGSNVFAQDGQFRTSLNNTTSPRGTGGVIAANDFWFIGGVDPSGTGSNNGAVVIASGNNGNEPIYVRQYLGPANPTTTEFPGTNSYQNELTLLDASGNTTLPGTLTLEGSTSGTITLSAGTTPAVQSYTLPAAYPTINGQVLASTTTGTMTWANSTITVASVLEDTYTFTPSGHVGRVKRFSAFFENAFSTTTTILAVPGNRTKIIIYARDLSGNNYGNEYSELLFDVINGTFTTLTTSGTNILNFSLSGSNLRAIAQTTSPSGYYVLSMDILQFD